MEMSPLHRHPFLEGPEAGGRAYVEDVDGVSSPDRVLTTLERCTLSANIVSASRLQPGRETKAEGGWGRTGTDPSRGKLLCPLW